MLSVPRFRPESLVRHFELVFEFGNHHHLDGVMLGKVITDPDADFASLAAVDSHECRLGSVIVKDGVGLRAELGTQATRRLTANGLVDMGDEIQRATPSDWADYGQTVVFWDWGAHPCSRAYL